MQDQAEVWRLAGQRIREARIAAGFSQEALSMDAEWDQSTLSKVERQGPQITSFRKLEALAEALGCIVDVTFKPKGSYFPILFLLLGNLSATVAQIVPEVPFCV